MPSPSTIALDDLHMSPPKEEPLLPNDLDSVEAPLISKIAWQSSPGDKLLLVFATVPALIVSITLLVLSAKDVRSTGSLLSFATDDRATAQIIVSILSSILSTLNVYTVTRLLNFAARVHMVKRSLSLDKLRLFSAITTRSIASDQPIHVLLLSTVIVLLFAIPNYLWTGALTPVTVTTTITGRDALMIPSYSPLSNNTWNYSGRDPCDSVVNEMGIFNNCPIDVLQSRLLSHAAQASSNSTQTYPKLDNTHYAVVGRSYGVGSSAGLADQDLFIYRDSSFVLSYNYTEYGYNTQVNCIHNETSAWGLRLVQPGTDPLGLGGVPNVYFAMGHFPQTPDVPDYFSVVAFDSPNSHGDNLTVVGSKSANGRKVILVTAGANYLVLNKTQCEVTFTPTLFAVTVDVTDKLVTVTPTNTTNSSSSSSSSSPGSNPTNPSIFFDPTQSLANTAIAQINNLGMVATSLYRSTVGDALLFNIASAPINRSPPSIVAANLSAISDFFAVILDDVLLYTASNQFFLPFNGSGDYTSTEASLTVQAVQIGEGGYIVAVFALSVVLVAAVVVEGLRTRGWRWLPRWEVTDFTSLMVASAVAGRDVAREMVRGFEGRRVEWTGRGRVGERGAGKGKGVGSRGRWREWMGLGKPKVPLRLGRKVVSVDWEGEVGDGDSGLDRRKEVQLETVALWTRGAEDVVPLVEDYTKRA